MRGSSERSSAQLIGGSFWLIRFVSSTYTTKAEGFLRTCSVCFQAAATGRPSIIISTIMHSMQSASNSESTIIKPRLRPTSTQSRCRRTVWEMLLLHGRIQKTYGDYDPSVHTSFGGNLMRLFPMAIGRLNYLTQDYNDETVPPTDISNGLVWSMLDRSQGFARAGVGRINVSISVYCWAILFTQSRNGISILGDGAQSMFIHSLQ